MSFRRASTLACLVVLVSACGSEESASGAGTAPERIGISDTDAQGHALDALVSGHAYGLVGVAGRTFKALPEDDRETLIEDFGQWARRYFESDAFASAYERQRDASRPAPATYTESVDDALQRRAKENLEELEKTRKNVVPMLPEADRAGLLKSLDSMQAQYASAEFRALERQGLEAQRAADQRSFEQSLERWNDDFPEDPGMLIQRRLQSFLDVCGDVDFEAELVERYDRMRFVETSYEGKPWEWKLCYRAGEDSVEAAREVARLWLEALG
jgi:hypothetical protein